MLTRDPSQVLYHPMAPSRFVNIGLRYWVTLGYACRLGLWFHVTYISKIY